VGKWQTWWLTPAGVIRRILLCRGKWQIEVVDPGAGSTSGYPAFATKSSGD